MMHCVRLFLFGLLQACHILGHYTFPRIAFNGVDKGGDFEYVRKHTSSIVGLYTNEAGTLNSTAMRCNRNGGPNTNTKTLTVTGGDRLAFKVASLNLLPGSLDHPGPSFVYLSKAPGDDVAAYDGSGDWFKVFEAGLCPRDPKNVNPTMDWCLNDKDRVEFKIPNNLPPGEYLARVEQLALHYSRFDQVQIYLSCAQIKVVNTTVGSSPGPMVKIPGLYTKDDPGLKYNTDQYPNPTPYVLPGPKLWAG